MNRGTLKAGAFLNLTMGLLLSMIALNFLLIAVPECNARSSFALGARSSDFTGSEETLHNSTCQFITTLAMFRGYETRKNYYGAQTSVIRICMCAAGGGDWATLFYVGEGMCRQVPQDQYQLHWYILDDAGNPAYDYVIYSFTTSQRARFAYIFACYSAHQDNYGNYGGSYISTGTIYGMAFGWMHDLLHSTDGYANPDYSLMAYVGWTGPAPYINQTISGADQAGYNFLFNFYNCALYYQHSLHDSLDIATYHVWSNVTHYANCTFYTGLTWLNPPSKQLLYGDGTYTLP